MEFDETYSSIGQIEAQIGFELWLGVEYARYVSKDKIFSNSKTPIIL